MRLGVYGGTFDPIHNAHLDIARAALAVGQLDRVLFVVAARPPHKGDGPTACAEDRLAMVEAALENEPQMTASRVELDRPGPSYTVDTLRALQGMHPGAELFLIVGLDMAMDFPFWRDTRGILERARVLIVPRPGAFEIPAMLRPYATVLPFTPVDLSSTEIRDRIQIGGELGDLLPAAVLQLIRRKGIYHAAS